MDWSTTKQVIADNKLELFLRTPELTVVYQNWRTEIKKKYAGPSDFLLHLLFQWPLNTNTEMKLQIQKPDYMEAIQTQPLDPRHCFILRQNDFPYNLSKEISHYCLWSTREMSDLEVEQYIKDSFGSHWETQWFVNPLALKSILDIWHAHIFIRPLLNE